MTFWVVTVQLLAGIVGIYAYCKKEEKDTMRKVCWFIYKIMSYLICILFILATKWRFSHTGKVCSGDFVSEGQELEPMMMERSGEFMKIFLISFYVFLLLGFLVPLLIFIVYR